MPAQNQPTQELTLSEKMKIVQYLAIFPAITIMVFIRRKVGFRMLKPSRLMGVAMFLWFINGLCNIDLLIFHPAGFLFTEFPLLFLLVALLQRYRRWRELCNGERWHTLSPGISYLEVLPLPAFLKAHRRIYRFVEPVNHPTSADRTGQSCVGDIRMNQQHGREAPTSRPDSGLASIF